MGKDRIVKNVLINDYVNKHNNRPSNHAEIVTYFRVPKRFRHRMYLIVVRLGPLGNLKQSKPCEKCMEFFRGKKITIYYSNEIGRIEKIKIM